MSNSHAEVVVVERKVQERNEQEHLHWLTSRSNAFEDKSRGHKDSFME